MEKNGIETTETFLDGRALLQKFEGVHAIVAFFLEDLHTRATEAIRMRGAFHFALAGGSTPKAIYRAIAENISKGGLLNEIDWTCVHLYWGDERAVPPNHPESNFHMALNNGLGELGIPDHQIHRMVAENNIREGARDYETLLKRALSEGKFDYILLGMGDDGHTASLFPHTEALDEQKHWVVANEVPQLGCWRMTLTFPLIQQARRVAICVVGKGKAETLKRVLQGPLDPNILPSQRLGTEGNPAIWVVDADAARLLS